MPASNKLFRFLLLISCSYGLWFVVYEYVLKPSGTFDHFITEYVTLGICNLLNWTGHHAYYTIALKPGETYIFVDNIILPAVRVGASCNGLELLVLFSLFILCYPGNRWIKIPFTVIGLLIIHLLNILRNYWLTLMSLAHSSWYHIFHRYIFIFMVYGAIFVLWMLWANYFSYIRQHHAH